MKKLAKGPKPPVLVANEATWTLAYLAAFGTAAERRAEKWRHAEIKQGLHAETGGKCAYCEGFVNDVSYLQVDHIAPKSRHPELAHIWSNLTAACGRCNQAKSDYLERSLAILGPYVDDPQAHFRFMGNMADWPLGDVRGEATIKILKLNRIDLVRARLTRLEGIKEMLERWATAEDAMKPILASAIWLDIDEGEFSSAAEQYALAQGFGRP